MAAAASAAAAGVVAEVAGRLLGFARGRAAQRASPATLSRGPLLLQEHEGVVEVRLDLLQAARAARALCRFGEDQPPERTDPGPGLFPIAAHHGQSLAPQVEPGIRGNPSKRRTGAGPVFAQRQNPRTHPLEQLGDVAARNLPQPAVADDDHPPGAGGLVQEGARVDHRGAPRVGLGKQVPKLSPGDGVDSGGGLVQKQQPGIVNQGGPQGELLLHPPGQALGQAAPGLREPGQFDHPLHARLGSPPRSGPAAGRRRKDSRPRSDPDKDRSRRPRNPPRSVPGGAPTFPWSAGANRRPG